MSIGHVCIICAFIFGYWYRGERDKVQLRITGQREKLRALSGELAQRRLTGKAIEAKMECVALTEGERAQSFYDDDLTQCIYDAARKAGVMAPAGPPTDAEMAAMGYSAFDIECIKEYSPVFNGDKSSKPEPQEVAAPDPRFTVSQGETWKSNAQTVTTTT